MPLDQGTQLPFQLVQDDKDLPTGEKGFASQDELDIHKASIGTHGDVDLNNNTVGYVLQRDTDGKFRPLPAGGAGLGNVDFIPVFFTRKGTVGNLWLEVGTVASNLVGVPMFRAGYIGAVIVADDSTTNDFQIRLGFNNINQATYPAVIDVVNGRANVLLASTTAPFLANDVLRCYLKTNPNNSSNPLVTVICKFT